MYVLAPFLLVSICYSCTWARSVCYKIRSSKKQKQYMYNSRSQTGSQPLRLVYSCTAVSALLQTAGHCVSLYVRGARARAPRSVHRGARTLHAYTQ